MLNNRASGFNGNSIIHNGVLIGKKSSSQMRPANLYHNDGYVLVGHYRSEHFFPEYFIQRHTGRTFSVSIYELLEIMPDSTYLKFQGL